MKNNKDFKSIVIVLLALINVSLLCFILYKNISSNNLKEVELKANFEELKGEYQDMKAELEQKTDLIQIQSSDLLESRMQLEAIFNKQQITEDDLARAKNLMKAISDAVFQKYKDRVVVLQDENVQLMSAKEIADSKNKKLSMEILGLENTNQKITRSLKKEKQISVKKDSLLKYASNLSADKFQIKAFKVRNSGKEIETDKASKIDRVKIYFDVRENLVATPGVINLFVLFSNEAGDLLNIRDKEGGKTLLKGKEVPFNDQITLNYDNTKNNPVELVYDSEDFERGTYKITLINSDRIIGEQLLDLR